MSRDLQSKGVQKAAPVLGKTRSGKQVFTNLKHLLFTGDNFPVRTSRRGESISLFGCGFEC